MSKALEYFEKMVECNQLDYQDEKPKCDLIESELKKAELFDNVASGKTIIFCGKSVVMMNHKKYIQYLDNTQFEEPYSKNLLRAENKELKENNARFLKKCERWLELLKTDGINSKSMVANDIQHLLKEMKQDEKDKV